MIRKIFSLQLLLVSMVSHAEDFDFAERAKAAGFAGSAGGAMLSTTYVAGEAANQKILYTELTKVDSQLMALKEEIKPYTDITALLDKQTKRIMNEMATKKEEYFALKAEIAEYDKRNIGRKFDITKITEEDRIMAIKKARIPQMEKAIDDLSMKWLAGARNDAYQKTQKLGNLAKYEQNLAKIEELATKRASLALRLSKSGVKTAAGVGVAAALAAGALILYATANNVKYSIEQEPPPSRAIPVPATQ